MNQSVLGANCFTQLPDEVIVMILRYLSVKPLMLVVRIVCRKWSRLAYLAVDSVGQAIGVRYPLCLFPRLTALDGDRVNLASCNAELIARLGRSLRSLTVLAADADPLLRSCSNLTALDLQVASNEAGAALANNLSCRTLRLAGELLPIELLTNLTSLSCNSPPRTMLQKLLLPSLTDLSVSGLYEVVLLVAHANSYFF